LAYLNNYERLLALSAVGTGRHLDCSSSPLPRFACAREGGELRDGQAIPWVVTTPKVSSTMAWDQHRLAWRRGLPERSHAGCPPRSSPARLGYPGSEFGVAQLDPSGDPALVTPGMPGLAHREQPTPGGVADQGHPDQASSRRARTLRTPWEIFCQSRVSRLRQVATPSRPSSICHSGASGRGRAAGRRSVPAGFRPPDSSRRPAHRRHGA
jgi:hypothetical protein